MARDVRIPACVFGKWPHSPWIPIPNSFKENMLISINVSMRCFLKAFLLRGATDNQDYCIHTETMHQKPTDEWVCGEEERHAPSPCKEYTAH